MEAPESYKDSYDVILCPRIGQYTGVRAWWVTILQEFIRILIWAKDIERVDILHEMSILSQYQISPREGHLDQVLHIFVYLKKNIKLSI